MNLLFARSVTTAGHKTDKQQTAAIARGDCIRLKLIACKVLQRELCSLAASCGHFVDITFVRQGYHNEPDRLREIVQHEIDLIDAGSDPHSCTEELGPWDAILVGYGLCSNGICGIRSSRHRLVVPRAHDCITLLLGSEERYRQVFDEQPGTYFFSAGWVENTDIRSEDEKRMKKRFEEYVQLYGEDNARYLIDFEHSWYDNYQRFLYIDWPGSGFPDYGADVEKSAHQAELAFERQEGSDCLIRDLLEGRWDQRFLVVPPGEVVCQSFDAGIIKSE